MSVNTIDVASYQSTEYDTKGLGMVLVKATEGTNYLNPRHAAQVATGREHALVVGHYHFVRPGSMTAQATYFLEHAAAKAGDVLALDWEDTGVTGAEKDAWIKHVQAVSPHNRVLLYCNRDFWLHHDKTGFVGDGLWIADPSAPAGHPRVDRPWTIHQYSDAGGVDRDVANFPSAAALEAWAAKGAPKPKPPTPRFEPFPGAHWFTRGRRSPIVAAMHQRLVAVGCSRYRSNMNKDVIGSGDIASYEAYQRKYNAAHHKHWPAAAMQWPPGKETWDALHVPHV
jgi:hypothetical protein